MEVLYSDKGSNFLSGPIMELYKTLGIAKRHTVAYNPQGNGLVERLNQTLIDSLSHLVNESQENWCQQVPLALLAFRTAFHRSIQETPAYLMYGRDLMLPYDLIFNDKFRTYSDTRSYAQNLIVNLQNTFQIITKNLEKAQQENVNSTPMNNSKQIHVGDLVYLHVPAKKPKLSKKLCTFNRGPYRVTQQFSPVLFQITHVTNTNDTQKVHANRLFKVQERQTFPTILNSQPEDPAPAPELPTSQNLSNEDVLPFEESVYNNPALLPSFDPLHFIALEESSRLPIPCVGSPQPSVFHDSFFDNLSPASFISDSPIASQALSDTPRRPLPKSKIPTASRDYGLRTRSAQGFVIYK
jgi:hypothetical protein